jgi:osmotically-inducible protein OsmY
VSGVKAVAVELDVKLSPEHVRSDTEIAQAVESALAWNAVLPKEAIKVKVDKAWVTLSGEVDWDYQRQSAEKAVRALTGLRGLTNLLTLKARAAPQDVAARIGHALARRARREAGAIQVTVSGSTVTLRGEVDSAAERRAAVAATWLAPGVTSVVNDLKVKT